MMEAVCIISFVLCIFSTNLILDDIINAILVDKRIRQESEDLEVVDSQNGECLCFIF